MTASEINTSDIPMDIIFACNKYLASVDEKMGYMTLPMISKAVLGMGRNAYLVGILECTKTPVFAINHVVRKKSVIFHFATFEEVIIFANSVAKYVYNQLGCRIIVRTDTNLKRMISPKKHEYVNLLMASQTSAIFHRTTERIAKRARLMGTALTYDSKGMQEKAKNYVITEYQ